jgi:hypothetical protein
MSGKHNNGGGNNRHQNNNQNQGQQEEVYSIVLSADSEEEKTIFLRKMKISYKGIAMKSALSRANNDRNHAMAVLDEELLKLLLVSVNGKDVSASQKEDLDSLFEPSEFWSLLEVLPQITGMDNGGTNAPQVKIAFTGKR